MGGRGPELPSTDDDYCNWRNAHINDIEYARDPCCIHLRDDLLELIRSRMLSVQLFES